MVRNVFREHSNALLGMHVDYTDSVFDQPINPAAEIHGLPDHNRADSKLADQPTAIPTWRKRRHHDFAAVTPLPARFSKSIRFAMRGRIALLHSAVVPASEQFSIAFEQRRTDGDSSFPEPNARLFHRCLQHREIFLSIFFCVRAHFTPLLMSCLVTSFRSACHRKHPAQEKMGWPIKKHERP